jgi:hypothetical protein
MEAKMMRWMLLFQDCQPFPESGGGECPTALVLKTFGAWPAHDWWVAAALAIVLALAVVVVWWGRRRGDL